MHHLPSLKKLLYLVTLHKLKHFGKTAEACFVSQSTLSAGIKDLEKLLGRVLIERNKKHMVFTATGHELVTQAKKILLASKDFTNTAEKFGQFYKSPLRLGIIPTIAPYILPKLMKTLSQNYPDMQVMLREDITDKLISQLKSGNLDCLIIALPYNAIGIELLSCFADPLRLIHHKNSQFLPNDKQLQIKQLAEESVILLGDGHCLRDHTITSCSLLTDKQINKFTTNSLTTIVQMVQYDSGLSYIPQMAIDAGVLIETDIAVKQNVISSKTERFIGLAWRDSSPFKEEFKQIGKHIKQVGTN